MLLSFNIGFPFVVADMLSYTLRNVHFTCIFAVIIHKLAVRIHQKEKNRMIHQVIVFVVLFDRSRVVDAICLGDFLDLFF